MGGWVGGGPWRFCLAIFIYFTREIIIIESFIQAGDISFVIYIIFISNSVVDKIFISTMPCDHLFISPIFQNIQNSLIPQQIFI